MPWVARAVRAERTPRLAFLESLIERAAQLLPAQGPITAFVFQNTLQALEDLPFEEGIAKGARLFGCQPYLPESEYRDKLSEGRIRLADVSAVLEDDLAGQSREPICFSVTRLALRMAMLRHPLQVGPVSELRWMVAETGALTRLRPDCSPAVRKHLIAETRHWVAHGNMFRAEHSREAAHESDGAELRSEEVRNEVLSESDRASIGRWEDGQWEALAARALWHICRKAVGEIEIPRVPITRGTRHRDLLLEATQQDADALVHEVLIRYCAAFADQGLARWLMPCRELGFYRAFFELYRPAAGPSNHWLRGVSAELARLERERVGPLESVLESLEILGLVEDEWDDYLTATLLALRGWTGLLRQMEVRPDRVGVAAPEGTLVEFLAVRLLLDRVALEHLGRQALGYEGSLRGLREAARAICAGRDSGSLEQRAFLVFQIAQVLGWAPEALARLSTREWSRLVQEIESFPAQERRRIFHRAFERRFRIQALDALQQEGGQPLRGEPAFQAVFCIDAREESFRRQLEEFAPRSETFGVAGFFAVPIYFRGLADAHFSALCPIVVRPQHRVVEDAVYTLEELHRRRARARRAVGSASHRVHLGSRELGAGALLSAGLGILASIPLVARVLFPRLTARIRRTAGELVGPPSITRLRLERIAEVGGPEEEQIGFSLDEMADAGERLLRDIGLTGSFARLVLFIGHGSSCLNNPHKSAYDCGACSGNAGGPNARAAAAMLNDHRVRERLQKRGLNIPAGTLFLGGQHNTCTDAIRFFDLDLLPRSHVADFEAARETLDLVCQRNAHERCRRFESAPFDLSFAAARSHVESRSEDLAQPRPEYGNATNALCVVGRRSRTRGLFLDRRAFLVSYDPLQDDAELTILARILGAVVPVTEGINLQYLLSSTDPGGWGAGTKLPHNVTALLGVMDGPLSDLRTGLPWQGVEIHEPLRLLFAIEATPKAILSIMEKNETVGRIFSNGWAQLALLDPHSSEILVFRNEAFEPYRPEASELPCSPSSLDWYRGRRDHLPFARIAPAL